MMNFGNKMHKDMRHTIKFLTTALAIAAIASCAKENPERTESTQENNNSAELVDFTAKATIVTTGGSSTKTALAEDGLTAIWTENDEIRVFPYTASSSSDSATPFDDYSVSIVNESIEGSSAIFRGMAAASPSYAAIYPTGSITQGNCYPSRWTFVSNTLKSQKVVKNTFPYSSAIGGPAHIAMALSSDKGDFELKNYIAYFKFSVGFEDLYTIELSAEAVSKASGDGSDRSLNSSVNLGGQLCYRPKTNKFDVYNGDDIITVTNDGKPFEKDVTYYIALPAVEISKLTMTGKDNEGTILFINKKTLFDVEVNNIYNIGRLAPDETILDPSFVATHTFENNILTGTKVVMTLSNEEVSKISNVKVEIRSGEKIYRSTSKANISTSETLDINDNNLYIPKGTYEGTITYDVSGVSKTQTVYINVPQVSGLSVTATRTPYTSYTKYKEGNISSANSLNGKILYNIGYSVNISQEILNKTPLSEARIRMVGANYIDKDGNKSAREFFSADETTNLPLGQIRTIQAIATFDGVQFFLTHGLTNVHITGLPHKPAVSDLGFTSLSGTQSKDYTPAVNLPSSTNVIVNVSTELASTRKYTGIPIYTYNVHTFQVDLNGASSSASSNSGNTNTVSKTVSVASSMNGTSTKINMSVSESQPSYDDPTCKITSFEILYK